MNDHAARRWNLSPERRKLCIGPSGGRLRPTYMGRACSAYATFALSASA